MSEWRKQWSGQVRTPDDMVRFVDAVGCATSKPIPAYPDFPSQQVALGPGASDVWFWKDDLHAEKRLYYTRVFGGQPGFVSNALLPALIATNGAVIDELLFEGVISVEAQELYRIIERDGPIPIRNLKRLLTPDAKRSADRLLIELERRFLITKSGITGRTRGTYGYIWDLVERRIPDMVAAADRLGEKQAAAIIRDHLAAFAIPPDSPFYAKVLGWQVQN